MSQGLYIGATKPFSGKNMLAVGIGLRLQKEGLTPGYMKPVGALPTEKNSILGDEDAFFVQDILALDHPADMVTPILVTQDFKMRAFSDQPAGDLGLIKSAYASLQAEHDVMLVGGSGHMHSGKYFGMDGFRLAHELDLKVIVIDRLSPTVNYDLLMAYKERLGERLIGVVLNDVPPSFTSEVNSLILPFLEKNGIPVLGVIPHDPLMSSIRAKDLAESLGGRLITAQSKATGMVESFLIGTMQVENFMTYFRRHQNAAVIVGGDRADVQLVAIEGDCPCLVLTGNLFPNDIILSRAETLNVPIIMVRDDTYSVALKMEQILNRHKLRDIIKVRQTAELINSTLNFNLLRQGLGM